MNKLIVSNHAVERIKRLPRMDADKVAEMIRQLQAQPFAPESFVALKVNPGSSDESAIRVMPVGDFRVVFRYDTKRSQVEVLNVYQSDEGNLPDKS